MEAELEMDEVLMDTKSDALPSGHGLTIRDVDVHLPVQPYSCQRVYMEKVIEALQNKVRFEQDRAHSIATCPTGKSNRNWQNILLTYWHV